MVHFLTQASLRPDAVAKAYDQHANHELGVNRGTASMAVIGSQMVA